MLKRKDWPSNPFIFTRSGVPSVTVIAFVKTPTGRWDSPAGGPPRCHAATAYAYRERESESDAELTIRAIEHWKRTCGTLPKGYYWTSFGIY